MSPAAQTILAQWHQGTRDTGARLQELLKQCAAGCQKLVADNPTDVRPLAKALAAVELQIRALSFAPGEAIEKAYDGIRGVCGEDRVSAAAALAEMTRTRRAFHRWADEAWMRFEAHWHGEQLRAMWPHVQASMTREIPCARCGAPLARRNPRQSESIRCAACGSVNQTTPDAVVTSYFQSTHVFAEPDLVEKRMALRKLEDEWEDHRDAEHAAGRERPDEPLARLEQRERLEKEYWTLHFEARVLARGGTREDVEREVVAEMNRGFYAHMNRNDVWRAAHGMQSVQAATEVPEHLRGTDEWGPLDPRQNANAVEDDMVHEYLLGEVRGDPARHAELLRELGYRDAQHRAMTHATFRRYYDDIWTTPEGQEAMIRVVKRVREWPLKKAAAAFDRKMLEPIEGISIELCGVLAARQATEKPDAFVKLLAEQQLDRAKWDLVCKAWGERMQRDPSGMIHAEYTKAWLRQGKYGAAGAAAYGEMTGTADAGAAVAEPIPLEKFCEVQGAWNAWNKQGKDGTASLAQRFQMTPIDLSNVAMYWTQKMMEVPDIAMRSAQLIQEYETKYLALQ